MIKEILIQQVPYNLLIIFNTIFYIKKINKKKYNRIIFISLIVLFFLNTFCSMTPDVISYKKLLKTFSEVGIQDDTEKIYYFLAKYINFNIVYFRGIISCLGYFLLYYYLKHKNLIFKKTFFIIFLLGFSYHTLNIIRNFVAGLFFLNAVEKYDRNKILCLIFMLCSIIFHKTFVITNLFFLFCCALNKIKYCVYKIFFYFKNKYFLIIIIIFSIIFRFSNFSSYSLIKIGINPFYTIKNIKYEGMIIWQFSFLFITILTNIIYFYFGVLISSKKKYSNKDVFSAFSIIGYFILYIAFQNTFISSRFIINSLLIIFISYSEFLINRKTKYIKLPLYLYALIFFIFNNMLIIRYISWNR